MEAITYDFEDPFISLSLSSPPFALVTNIGADDPWSYRSEAEAACIDTSGIGAGLNGAGVDKDSMFSVEIPPGATSVSYFYSFRGIGKFGAFLVSFNGNDPVRSYSTVPQEQHVHKNVFRYHYH